MIVAKRLPEFDRHARVVRIQDKETGIRGYIAIHRGGTPAQPAFGATRLWRYASEREALQDALRLSRLMTYKSAVAGFAYGGGKGVLMMPENGIQDRKLFFEAYARKVDEFDGGFITGTDVGVTDGDVLVMKGITPHVVGSRLDPAFYTAIGVAQGIGVALQHKFHSPQFRGRTFAIQGLGKVGSNVLEKIYRNAAALYVADIDKRKVARVKKKFAKIKVTDPRAIHALSVDVFVPCALGGVINGQSVAEFRCKIVAGSANNQLADQRAGDALWKKGILYAPDYIINIGGYIGVVDEFENGAPNEKRIVARIRNMEDALGMVFENSAKSHKAPSRIADSIAKTLMKRH